MTKINTKNNAVYGIYSPPFKIKRKNFIIEVKKEKDSIMYTRISSKEKVEKIILASEGTIVINPIEPVNKPKEITPYLLVEFENKILIEPKLTQKVFITFPIEIGVFIKKDKKIEIVDIISTIKQKYTLYGDIKDGTVCRYWKSETFFKLIYTDPLEKGIMELDISNTTDEWIDTGMAVFDAYGMKIYYNDKLVSMKAKMRILGKELAETEFKDAPMEKNMKKSIELYQVKKLPMIRKKFIMEWGI